MAGLCPRCKLATKDKYWHELPATKHKFCKIMLDDFKYQLRFPHEFVECFRGKLARECRLRGPSGNEWKVRVEKTDEDGIVMSTGWEIFVRDHGVHLSDFLTFRYLGGSAFEVSIFNATGCEREGAYFARNGTSSTACTSTLHGGENHGFDCLFESEEESDNPTEEGGLAEQHSEGSSEELNGRGTRGRQGSKCKSTKHKRKSIDISKSKAKKKRVGTSEDLDMSEKEGEDDEAEESSCGEDILWAHCFRPNKRRGESSNAKQCKRYYISNRRSVTEEEKQRTYDNAVSHMKSRKPSGVPMFAVTMSQTNVSVGFNLTIPKEWALKHMLEEPHKVELKVPGEMDSWTVGCRWTPSQCQIRAQWSRFVLENNLEEHDVCVFELFQKGEPGGTTSPVFIVNIFRVVTETVPLTSIRL